MSQSVPFFELPNDNMRGGLFSARDLAAREHPVESLQKNFLKNDMEKQSSFLKRSFGVHAAMRMSLEASILAQYQRLPGLHSEFVGLDTLTGADEHVTFEDILNDPRDSYVAPPSLHEVMEKRLGISINENTKVYGDLRGMH